ncbi:MAG: penicillin-binding protein [Myxococcota bacterium]
MTDRIHLPPLEPALESAEVVRRRARSRIRLVSAAMCALLAVVGARGAVLCVAPSSQTLQAAVAQRWDQVTLRASRGDVLDRNGHRLATSIPTPNVVVDPVRVEPDELDALATAVAGIVGIPVEDVAERMSRRPSRYQRIAVQVHPAIARAIEGLDHGAVWVEREPRRYYPEQTLAAQVLGFVDAAGSGREGLEASLDHWLRGESVLVQRDRNALSDDPIRSDVSRGMDVELTLDRTVQRIAERALDDVVRRSAPHAATAVVIDVKTGDLLALANAPTFNPNALEENAAPRRNHAVQDAIEPGSVMKPFTVAAAVEEGLVSPDTVIDCESGTWLVGRSRIRDTHPHGAITVREVLKVSSNIGSAKLAFELGEDRFLRFLSAFGFGKRAGTMLAGERAGFLRDPAKIRPIELATTAFGQGITATPLQLGYALAALGNGGVRMKPRLVARVRDAHDVPEYVQSPTAVQRAVSETTARLVVSMMEGVTEDGGTAIRARVPGYRVAGKTGTAQKAEGGKYGAGRIGSFVGLVPADDPVLAIVVTVDDPTIGSRMGGVVAAPAFSAIAAESLRYLGVRPTEVIVDPELDAPTLAAAPPPAEPADPIAASGIAFDGEQFTVPDLRGRPLREVVASLAPTGLPLSLRGTGAVVTQDPPPGTRAAPGTPVSLTLQ